MTVDAFALVAEPNRRRILDELSTREASVGELTETLDLAQPAVSKHLRVLRDGGVVVSRVEAQRRVYSIATPSPLMEIEAWLGPYRRFWSARLDALGKHLDATEAKARTKTARTTTQRKAR